MMIVIGMMLVGTAIAMDEHKMPTPKPGSAEFERIKNLAGVWKGTTVTDGKTEPAGLALKAGRLIIRRLFLLKKFRLAALLFLA